MRNTSEAVRHSYLNQHNSGDEWLTGFGGEGKGEGGEGEGGWWQCAPFMEAITAEFQR